MRRLLAPLLAAALLATGAPAFAQAPEGFLQLTFQPVSLAMYDGESEYAFFPSKGIQDYVTPDEPPRGYVAPADPGQAGRNTQYFLNTDDEQNTRQIFALIRIKIVNYYGHQEKIEGSDFYLQGERGDVYPPHPFTVSTTHLLMQPKQSSFLDLGFEVPGGKYSLYYKTQLPDGKSLSDEVWRYDITIDRGPVGAIFRMVPELVTRYIDGIFSFLAGLVGLND